VDGLCASALLAPESVALAGLRLGVPRGYFYDGLDPQTDTVVAAALALLESAGAVLVEADLDGIAEANAAVSFPVVLFEVLRELSAYLYGHGSRMSVLDIVDHVAGPAERDLLTGLTGDGAIPAAAYREALVVARPRLQALYAGYFAANDVAAIIVPTTPLPARPIGEDDTVELNGERVPTFPTYIRNTDPPSNAGLPAISLPAGLTAAGLPVGLELVGPAMADAHLLAVARAVEQLLPPLPPPRI
jgi:mandelamide amidase